jgi:hypothetical protein
MSRGPGKWQRYILQSLMPDRPAVWLRDLLPKPCAASHYQALYRAAYVLSAAGKIGIWSSMFAKSELIVALPGHEVRNRNHVPRLSVESVPFSNGFNTYEKPRDSQGDAA